MAATNARRPQVVIIGAGFAGLGAAQKLLSDQGKRFDVIVLEGSSKIGGRIKSVSFSGSYNVELGAAYLYYYSTFNSLGEYLRAKGTVGEIDYSFYELEDADKSAIRLLSNGEVLSRDLVKYYEGIYFKVGKELCHRAKYDDWSFSIDSKWGQGEPVNPKETSYEEYMAKRFHFITDSDLTVNTNLASSSWKRNCILENLNLFEAFMNGTTGSENVDLAAQCGNFINPEGSFVCKGSYQDIAHTIASDFPPSCLHLNSEVQSIQWIPNSERKPADMPPITIVCTNGTLFHADHVIVTVSLGVLQQKCDPSSSSTFFFPQLPQEKVSSIMKLGMGKGCTVAVEFPQPLIRENHCSIELYWLNNEAEKQHFSQYPWARKQYILLHVENSNVYKMWFSGEEAEAVEKATEFELAEGICLMLEKFLQRPIDRPVRVERSTWCGDKLFLGSYSYYHTGSTRLDREVLAQPVNGSTPLQLLFAGEATHPSIFSTTVGAYESGIREADRLLSIYSSLP